MIRPAAGAMFARANAASDYARRTGCGIDDIQGRPNGNLHFAGEHTSLDFQGYLEGALRTGYRCAREVAQ
ncbi:MAG TPA: FAD-dependent oxidoreductase [Streptosporangiaceae bacterium]|nr:FAD-dependent oxidoreductase [Streptosporangiaceae bacterium]